MRSPEKPMKLPELIQTSEGGEKEKYPASEIVTGTSNTDVKRE